MPHGSVEPHFGQALASGFAASVGADTVAALDALLAEAGGAADGGVPGDAAGGSITAAAVLLSLALVVFASATLLPKTFVNNPNNMRRPPQVWRG
jgi:hypothetical protein